MSGRRSWWRRGPIWRRCGRRSSTLVGEPPPETATRTQRAGAATVAAMATSSKDEIRLTGISVRAHHGVYPEEQEKGQEFVVDVVAQIDLSAAGESDRLEDTVDYGALGSEGPRPGRHRTVEPAGTGRRARGEAGVGRRASARRGSDGPQAAGADCGAVRRRLGDGQAVALTRAAVALGSNLGDRTATLHSAIAAIAQLGDVVAVSGFHETAPVGGPEQGDFLNAVVLIDTALGPEELLAGLHRIEDDHGRVRVGEVGSSHPRSRPDRHGGDAARHRRADPSPPPSMPSVASCLCRWSRYGPTPRWRPG